VNASDKEVATKGLAKGVQEGRSGLFGGAALATQKQKLNFWRVQSRFQYASASPPKASFMKSSLRCPP